MKSTLLQHEEQKSFTVEKIPLAQQIDLRYSALVSIQKMCWFPFQRKNCEIKCPPLLEHSDHA